MLAGLAVSSAAPEAAAQWTRWGGPTQNFQVDVKGLADKWPEDGPKKLWTRELGEGYAGVLVDDGVLYTMYRSEGKERIVALGADDGSTVWEHAYDESPADGHVKQFGEGPRGTPLIIGDDIYSVGVAGQMTCLNKKTGKLKWSHDLWEEYKAYFLNHGYSSSPFEYKDTVIVLTGGEGNAIMAFNKNDGKLAWKNLDFTNSYSTPSLINVDGQDQLLCYMGQELIAINPNNGELYWRYEIGNQWGQNICQPVYGDGNMLFLSTTGAGSRGLKLTRDGDKTNVEEVWKTRKVQLYHVTSISLGDYVYGSSGAGMGKVNFFSCINRKTGKIAWRERGLSKATTLYADGKFIILDEDGKLALVKADPENFEIVSEAQVCEKVAWTVPTLVGKTLYVRDQKNITALDIG